MGVFAAIANRLGRNAPTNPPPNRGLAPLIRSLPPWNEFGPKDGPLQAIRGTREGALAGLPWVVEAAIVPGAAQPTKRELKVAEFVSNALRYAEGRGQDS